MGRVIIIAILWLFGPMVALAQTQGPAVTHGMQTCENGLKRCGGLAENPAAYWLCMETTCADFALQTQDAACRRGEQACRGRLLEYRACIGLICRNPRGTYSECEAGKRQCGKSLSIYWDCVYKECLGDTAQFKVQVEAQARREEARRNNEKAKERGYRQEFIGTKEFRYDLEGKLIPPLLGAPDSMRYPKDPGISPQSYVMETLPIRMLKGTPGATVECISPHANLVCGGQDMSSCSCSDGSTPVHRRTRPVVAEVAPYDGSLPYMPTQAPTTERGVMQMLESTDELRQNIRRGMEMIRQLEAERSGR